MKLARRQNNALWFEFDIYSHSLSLEKEKIRGRRVNVSMKTTFHTEWRNQKSRRRRPLKAIPKLILVFLLPLLLLLRLSLVRVQCVYSLMTSSSSSSCHSLLLLLCVCTSAFLPLYYIVGYIP